MSKSTVCVMPLRAILERRDTIIVASVSCLYGLGSVESYAAMRLYLKRGTSCDRDDVTASLVALQYRRNNVGLERGIFGFVGIF